MEKGACQLLLDRNGVAGLKLCEMTDDQVEEFLSKCANRGAAAALAAVGLGDETAGSDIRDVRNILRGFRFVKKEAISTTLKGIGQVAGWAVLFALLAAFTPSNNSFIKQAFERLMGK